MSTSSRTLRQYLGAAITLAAMQMAWGGHAVAQPSGASSNPSQAGKSEAIYLDEPDVVAEPTIVRTEKIPPEKYEDGTVRVEREVAYYSDNHIEAEGAYREYYPNGKLFVEGQYRRGRQHGEWTFYFDNGQVNRKANYTNGQPDGAWDVHRADGSLSAKRSFRNGLKDGEWISFDETGKKPLRQENYAVGKRDGEVKIWFPNGQLKQEIAFKADQAHGVAKEWDESGKLLGEVNYSDGKLNGNRTLYQADGSKLIQEFKDGRFIKQTKQ